MGIMSIARSEVVTAGKSKTVQELVDMMEENNVGSIIITSNGEPVGIVTDRDITINVIRDGKDPSEVRASEIMGNNLVSVNPDADIYELTRIMGEDGVRRVPIVDNDGLQGIITLDDVIILLGMELQNLGQMIRSSSPAYEVSATEIYGN